ncbi:MAG: hypothetical protein OEZ43_00395 [Gammaproteobacteria bacterium]|nr:hypothetical protein [Gammaproteobacteria bacterium]
MKTVSDKHLARPLICGLLTLLLASPVVEAESEFEKWKRQQLNDFSEYKSKLDREFADHLKASWIEIKGRKEKPLFDEEKVITPPKAPEPPPSKTLVEPLMVTLPERKPPPKPVPPPPAPKPVVHGVQVKFDFFGNELAFPYDRKIQQRMSGVIDKETLSERWSLLAKSEFEPLLKQLQTSQRDLQLNDWAYAILVDRVARDVYPRQTNEQVLFSWFLLIKSGYRARLAYQDRQVFLLLPVKQQIYSSQSLSYNNQKYYILDFDGGKQPRVKSVFTYDSEYDKNNKLFDLQLNSLPITGDKTVKRKLEFSYTNNKYAFETTNNQYIVEFMKTYPQVHWDVYFNANPVSSPRQQLADQLRPVLQGLTELDAINLLLRFSQTSFKYDTDDKQFGFEKPLFPEETLFYPASDCEDRSFIFAWLVNELLGLDVVGLLYPGHMATAVRLNTAIDGDTITHKGKTFYITDPTYINANIGMAMPKFKKQKPEVLKIEKLSI